MTNQPDDFTAAIVKLWIARALEGESQIDEHIQWNVETKARVPLTQMATAMLGLLATLCGLFLIGTQAAPLLGLQLAPGDYLLVSTLALILLLVILAAVRYLAQAYSPTAAMLLAGVLLLLLVIASIATIKTTSKAPAFIPGIGYAREQSALFSIAAVALGFALLLPGLALTYRQLIDLIDPFGKTSPMERMLYPHLDQIFGGAQEPESSQARLIPRRQHGQLHDAISSNGDRHESGIHPNDLDFIGFIREASQRGLARADLVTQPRIRLRPTGTKLTRPVYDEMIQRADAQWGFIDRGGGGHPANWLTEPARALAILEEEMQRIRETI